MRDPRGWIVQGNCKAGGACRDLRALGSQGDIADVLAAVRSQGRAGIQALRWEGQTRRLSMTPCRPCAAWSELVVSPLTLCRPSAARNAGRKDAGPQAAAAGRPGRPGRGRWAPCGPFDTTSYSAGGRGSGRAPTPTRRQRKGGRQAAAPGPCRPGPRPPRPPQSPAAAAPRSRRRPACAATRRGCARCRAWSRRAGRWATASATSAPTPCRAWRSTSPTRRPRWAVGKWVRPAGAAAGRRAVWRAGGRGGACRARGGARRLHFCPLLDGGLPGGALRLPGRLEWGLPSAAE